MRVSSSQTYPWFPIPSGLGTHSKSHFKYISVYITTVDGWNPANQLRLVVYPIIYRVSAPSQVVVWDFSHQQYHALSLQWHLQHSHISLQHSSSRKTTNLITGVTNNESLIRSEETTGSSRLTCWRSVFGAGARDLDIQNMSIWGVLCPNRGSFKMKILISKCWGLLIETFLLGQSTTTWY